MHCLLHHLAKSRYDKNPFQQRIFLAIRADQIRSALFRTDKATPFFSDDYLLAAIYANPITILGANHAKWREKQIQKYFFQLVPNLDHFLSSTVKLADSS
jgi:hypothetical protein